MERGAGSGYSLFIDKKKSKKMEEETACLSSKQELEGRWENLGQLIPQEIQCVAPAAEERSACRLLAGDATSHVIFGKTMARGRYQEQIRQRRAQRAVQMMYPGVFT